MRFRRKTIKIYLIVAISFVVAVFLSLLPMPEWAMQLKPQWVLLVLLYWLLALPHRFGMGFVWCLGLYLDGLNNTVLGEHALALVMVAFIIMHYQRRLWVLPARQQALVCCLLILLYQLVLVAVQTILGLPLRSAWYWGSAVVSALLWPWLHTLLVDVQRHYQITEKIEG